MSDFPSTPGESEEAEPYLSAQDLPPPARWSDRPPEFEVDQASIRETSPRKVSGFALSDDEFVELQGRQAFFRLRGLWSGWIIGWISALIAFNVTLTALVGLKVMDFTGYQWFVTAVTVETFLQIVGMGYIAVKFLFSDGKTGK